MRALHNACKALLASAFVLSFGFATQNPNLKETKPQEVEEVQETNQVATTQTSTPPTHTQENQQESKQENQESKQEPIQTYSVPCAQDCQMQSDSKQNESSTQSSQESTDELATQESQEQLAQEQLVKEEQTRPFEIEPMNKEKSGAFVGLSIGATSLSADFSAGFIGQSHNTDWGKNREFSVSGSRGGATGIYGIMIGYKHAITGGFGLRYYADFNYISPSLAQPKMWGMNYGLNIDGLLNIVEKNNNFFGFFAGVGLGAQSYGWSDKILENDLEFTGENGGRGDGENGSVKLLGERGDKHKNQNFKNPVTSFNVAINFGVRLNVAKHHDIELGARFRPMKHTLTEVKMEYETGKGNDGKETHTKQQGLKAKIGSPYDIFLRYIFVF